MAGQDAENPDEGRPEGKVRDEIVATPGGAGGSGSISCSGDSGTNGASSVGSASGAGGDGRPARIPLAQLGALIVVGLACVIIFSRVYSPGLPKNPASTGIEQSASPSPAGVNGVGAGQVVITQITSAAGSLAGSLHNPATAAAGPIGASAGGSAGGVGGGIPANPRVDPTPDTCECGILHRLWLTEPRMVGPQVEDLQQGLATAGYLNGHADGVFGPSTDKAVRRFQEDMGFPADGVVDMAVWMALGRICEPIMSAIIQPSGDIVPELKNIADSGIHSKTDTGAGWYAILIDTSDLTLTLLKDGLPVKQYRVGIGMQNTPTPVGQWKVIGKAAWAGGFGTRWMGLDVPWGKFGIHGTNKPWTIGQRRSGGCIRMLNRDVEELYPMVAVGTPVIITAGHIGILGTSRPRIEPGAKGSYVLEVQRRLVNLGYSSVTVDGAYGLATERAIMQLQRDCGIPATGIVDSLTYAALGLTPMD